MNSYTPYSFYHLRMPLFPVNSILELNRLLEDMSEASYDVGLKEIFSNPLFCESIYLASPELYDTLLSWIQGELTDPKKVTKLIRALYRYYARISTRSTPYGIFAGCAVGTISDSDSGIRFAKSKIQRHSRLDMKYLTELIETVSARQDIKSQLLFFPNNSMYSFASKYRYLESKRTNKDRSYNLTAIAASEYTTKIYHRASSGATIKELVDYLLNDNHSRLPESKVVAFINNLISAEFLVSELTPSVTGSTITHFPHKKIKELKGAENIAEKLVAVEELLRHTDNAIEQYRNAEKIARELLPEAGPEIIQTDLVFLMEENNIRKDTLACLLESIRKFLPLGKPYQNPPMQDFKTKFLDRYEYREVALLQALDADIGIGYGLATNGNVEFMPLLANLAIPPAHADTEFVYDDLTQLKFKKAKESLLQHSYEVQITDEELNVLVAKTQSREKCAPTAYVFGNLVASSAEDLDKGNFKFVANLLFSPHPGKILSRFAQGDSDLARCLDNCMQDEAIHYKDALMAEIVHLPENSRMGNIVARPVLRKYEIPYLSRASVADDFVIPADDLFIRIAGGKVILRSKRLNKEVIPRLTSAHNYSQGLPLYRFLADLQYEGITSGFSWGWQFLYSEPFLPRVSYKNIILSRARWYLKKIEKSDFKKMFTEFRAKWNLPRYVVIAENDNELLIDCDSAFCLSLLENKLKAVNVTLLEFLSLPGSCPVKDEFGSYASEIILPVFDSDTKMMVKNEQKEGGYSSSRPDLKRMFAPGSEWLYLKIYCSYKTMEHLLSDIFHDLISEVVTEYKIEEWFYVRYNDPDSHIRIRFFKSKDTKGWISDILKLFHDRLDSLLEDGRIMKIMVDTYVRELERYGSDTMELSERIFFADSKAMLNFLSMIEGDEGEEIRIKAAYYSIDLLMQDFDLSSDERCSLMEGLQTAFINEFNNRQKPSGSQLAKSLNSKYRNSSKLIDGILTRKAGYDEMAEVLRCFNERSENIGDIAKDLKHKLAQYSNQGERLKDLLASYIHMSMNRLFVSKHRMHELVLYHHLYKYYGSISKRMAGPAADDVDVLFSRESTQIHLKT